MDYDKLEYKIQRELDQKAYSKYFSDCYSDNSDDDISFYKNKSTITAKPVGVYPLTFNEWYGTSLHKKYLVPLLRKYKLEKINSIENIF